MSLKKLLIRGQAALEYVILLAVVSSVVFVALDKMKSGTFFDNYMKRFFVVATERMAAR